jgi:hypothetical protein
MKENMAKQHGKIIIEVVDSDRSLKLNIKSNPPQYRSNYRYINQKLQFVNLFWNKSYHFLIFFLT